MDFNSRKHNSSTSLSGLLLVFLSVVSIGVFILLAHEVVVEKEDWFDTIVFTYFSKSITPVMIPFFRTITLFGSTKFLLPSYLLLILLFIFKNRKKEAIYVAIAGILSILLVYELKLIFARKRPEAPLYDVLTNYSFPSGHSLSSIVFFGILLFFTQGLRLKKIWKGLISFLLSVFVLAIGISRIVLHYHYASDVIAGYCIGLVIVFCFSLIAKKSLNKR